MKTRVAARRYAEAFFKVISAANLDEEYNSFRAFASISVGPSSELGAILRHPTIRFEQKQHLVRVALEGSASSTTADFVILLIRKHRFSLFSLIIEEVEGLFQKTKGIVLVQVKSAVPLLPEERESLRERLNRRVAGTVELCQIVDPLVKGGLVVSFENRILDASVKSKLKHLQERMNSLSAELLEAMVEPPSQLS